MGLGCLLAFQGLDSEAGQSTGHLGKTCPGPNQGAAGRCPGVGAASLCPGRDVSGRSRVPQSARAALGVGVGCVGRAVVPMREGDESRLVGPQPGDTEVCMKHREGTWYPCVPVSPCRAVGPGRLVYNSMAVSPKFQLVLRVF